MSLAVSHRLTNRCPSSRLLGGRSLRAVAWVVLASWLFSLAVCSISVMGFDESSSHHFGPGSSSGSNPVDNHAQHGGGDKKHADPCCSVLQNLSAFSQVSSLQAMLYDLTYVLLPVIAVIYAVLFLPALIVRYFGADPPGKPNHALTANTLWPHAPPL